MSLEKGIKVAASAGGVGLTIVGASSGAISTATIIVATGGAAAIVIIGFGICMALVPGSKNLKNPKDGEF